MRQQAKQVFGHVYALPRRLGEKSAFVAIWGGVAAHHWGTTRAGQARRLLSVLIPAGLRQRTRQRVKRVLIWVPGIRSYLAEKYTLQESWYRVAEERDGIKLERNRLEAEIERHQVTLDDLTAERDALREERGELRTDIEKQRDDFAVARAQFKAEVQRQVRALEDSVADRKALSREHTELQTEVARLRTALDARTSERDALLAAREQLQADLERHRLSIEALVSERDTLLAMREQLQAEVKRLSVAHTGLAAEREALVAERSGLQADLERHRLSIEALVSERDALLAECDQLHAEVNRQARALEAMTAERGSLLAECDRLHAEVNRQGAANAGLVAEREALAVERTTLQADVERHRVAVESLLSERDALLSGRENLLRHVEAVEAERNQLLAAVTQLQKHVEEFQLERSKYQDAMLGRLVTVQSQFNTFQRNLLRLGEIPNGAIADELSRDLYLDLLEESLIGTIIRDESIAPWHEGYDQARRELGRDWPKFAFTMIGKARMRNLRELTETILEEAVPGDLLEAGVWRGGACIYMRGILKARGITDRAVWVADSFAGLPPPNAKKYPADKDDAHHRVAALAISLEEVRDNFSRFGLLDEQVRFLKGWFKDTLPPAPVNRLALLRLDGDMYESTIQTLDAMYWRLSPRGFIIIDDYVLSACKKAVDDFRSRHRITAKLEMVDGAAVYWRKQPSEKKEKKEKKVVKQGAKRRRRGMNPAIE